jgi:DNA invertase Pin-like site-specific DNA recombinase
MRVALYARVSTADKQDLSAQLAELKRYVVARGWTVGAVYTDYLSGARPDRPGYQALRAACRRRVVDAVVVTRLDRFSRSLKELLTALEELRVLGVDFVSLHETLDTTTAAGRMMLHIVGAFAEFERELIRERVRMGLAHARARGRRLGRPRVVDQAQVWALRRQGLSYSRIAAQLRASRTAVIRACQRWCENPVASTVSNPAPDAGLLSGTEGVRNQVITDQGGG